MLCKGRTGVGGVGGGAFFEIARDKKSFTFT